MSRNDKDWVMEFFTSLELKRLGLPAAPPVLQN
jgi:hypothetical protein